MDEDDKELKGYCPCCGAPVYWNRPVKHDEFDHCTLEDCEFDNYRD